MLESSDKHELIYAVCRFHAQSAQQRRELRQRDFAVVKVVRDELAAQQEVERLNALNRGKGNIYFYQATRLERGM